MNIEKDFLKCREFFFDFFLPKSCLLCNKGSDFVCKECESKLSVATLKCVVCSRKNPAGLTCKSCHTKTEPQSLKSCFAFSGGVQSLVHLFKYEDVSELKYFFADKLERLAKTINKYEDYSIQPIPLSPRKLRMRGYNQSKLIAKLLCEKLKVPLTDSLGRVDALKSQVETQGKKERFRNVKTAFFLKNRPPENVILLDDIVTTGSTMRRAAKVLYKGGAKKIICISIAC